MDIRGFGWWPRCQKETLGVKWKSVKGKRGQYDREEVTVRVIFILPMPEILQPCCCDSLVTDWHLKPALTLVQTTPPVSLLFNFMTAQRVTPGSRFLSKSKRLWAERQRIQQQRHWWKGSPVVFVPVDLPECICSPFNISHHVALL